MQTTDKKLLDRVRDTIRLKHYSVRTACHEACGELVEPPAEGNKPTLVGSNTVSSFTASAIP